MTTGHRKLLSYYEYTRRRIRHSGITRLVLEAFAKIGFNLRPFVLFRESGFGNVPPAPNTGFEEAEIRYLGADDMHLLTPFSQYPGRSFTRHTLLARIEAGNRCIALFLDGELAAFSWYDLERCSFGGYPFKLRDNEVYLFDTYTPIAFRGKGLAPRTRQFMYRELARQGRDICYSFADRLNRPAVRFKEKLRAKRIVNGYCLVLFWRWHFTFFVRKLDADAPSRES